MKLSIQNIIRWRKALNRKMKQRYDAEEYTSKFSDAELLNEYEGQTVESACNTEAIVYGLDVFHSRKNTSPPTTTTNTFIRLSAMGENPTITH